MFLSLTPIQWIKSDKDPYHVSLSSTLIVLFLFVGHLILIPFTFTPLWHCPMMDNTEPSSSMIMNMSMDTTMNMPCMTPHHDTKNKSSPHKKQIHHGIFICPLCNGLALPNPLLGYSITFPEPTIIVTSFKHKIYQAHAPPILPIETTLPRPPPLVQF